MSGPHVKANAAIHTSPRNPDISGMCSIPTSAATPGLEPPMFMEKFSAKDEVSTKDVLLKRDVSIMTMVLAQLRQAAQKCRRVGRTSSHSGLFLCGSLASLSETVLIHGVLPSLYRR